MRSTDESREGSGRTSEAKNGHQLGLESESRQSASSDAGAQAETVEVTEEMLEKLRRERDEYFDLLLRKQAEFENYRKRVQREQEEARAAARADVISELLLVLDACDRGLETLRNGSVTDTCEPYVEGYELLARQLRQVLERFGVREVPAVGTSFDPNIHEAVVSEATTDHRENEILDEFRKGYLIGDRLLRPSQVKVATRPQTTE